MYNDHQLALIEAPIDKRVIGVAGAEALEDHLHSLNGEHLGGNSLAVRGQERQRPS